MLSRLHLHLAVALFLVPALPVQGQAGGRLSDPPVEPWQTRVDSMMGNAARIPVEGISVAVMRGDDLVLVRAYGLANLERNRPADSSTLFEIGSITKQFTAAAVMRLAEQDRLGLDDALGDHLPALREAARGVTLRNLLNHTSGLSRRWTVSDLTARSSPQAVIDSLASREVEFAPGERHAYNNNGYILLGLIIEKIAGVPYVEYLRTTFLQPLGLTSIMPCNEVPADRMAVGYVHPTRGPATPSIAPTHSPTVTYSAGMLCSTAADLARWERALATGKVVNPESWREMTTPTVVASGRPASYGLGVETREMDGLRYLSHGGATPGFLGEAAHLPDSALAVVVLTNGIYAGDIVSQLTRNVARHALGMPVPIVADLPLTEAERARFVGSYDLGPMTLEIYQQGDRLRAEPQGQLSTRLLYQGDGVFWAEHDPSLHFSFVVADGHVQSLTIEQGGRAMPPAIRIR